jgi:hypothetical protein
MASVEEVLATDENPMLEMPSPNVDPAVHAHTVENRWQELLGQAGPARNLPAALTVHGGQFTQDAMRRFVALLGSRDKAVSAAAGAFLMAKITLQQCDAMIDNNCRFPFNFFVPGPWWTWVTGSFIYMVAGARTMGNFTRERMMEAGHNVNSQLFLFSFNIRMQAIVINDRNVCHMHNLWCQKHLRGGGHTLFSHRGQIDFEEGEHDADMFSFLVPVEQQKLSVCVNLNGKDGALGVDQPFQNGKSGEYDFASSGYYNKLFGWGTYGRPVAAPEAAVMARTYSPNNIQCYRDWHARYNPETGKFDDFISSETHLGQPYTRCTDAREGINGETLYSHAMGEGVPTAVKLV